MKQLKFKCTLLSDIILNVKSASEGENSTLDFIPGSNFMGIVAGQLYDKNDPDTMLIVHSGEVKFGDAHPLYNNVRALRTPASLFYPKLSSIDKDCYVHHEYKRSDDEDKIQLKQCRSGFYAFNSEEKTAIGINHSTNFALKSAYDRDSRKSKDSKMFGYESLPEGHEYCFSVMVPSDELGEKIGKCLIGKRRIGRSRSAQYGLVEIKECDFTEIKSNFSPGNDVIIYAESRLIFLNKDGDMTFQPEIEDLGLAAGEIDWEKSQIRTFSYAPWNYKRQSFDFDRCCIEKGSVIYVKNAKFADSPSEHIGIFHNEGFGKVIYNPDFFSTKANSNGLSAYQFNNLTVEQKNPKTEVSISSSKLINYLKAIKVQEEVVIGSYKLVNDFVSENEKIFKGESFASQWGNIRSIASTEPNKEQLIKKILDYLTHGIAKEKWEEKGRLRALNKLFKDNRFTESNAQLITINLASTMAKKCK